MGKTAGRGTAGIFHALYKDFNVAYYFKTIVYKYGFSNFKLESLGQN